MYHYLQWYSTRILIWKSIHYILLNGEKSRILIGIKIISGEIGIFTMLHLPMDEHSMFLHSFRSLISFTSVLSFLAYSCYTCSLRFIQKYFFFIGTVLKGICEMFISILLVYWNAIDFCVLTLYSATLWYSLSNSKRFFVEYGVFSMYTTSCHL